MRTKSFLSTKNFFFVEKLNFPIFLANDKRYLKRAHCIFCRILRMNKVFSQHFVESVVCKKMKKFHFSDKNSRGHKNSLVSIKVSFIFPTEVQNWRKKWLKVRRGVLRKLNFNIFRKTSVILLIFQNLVTVWRISRVNN